LYVSTGSLDKACDFTTFVADSWPTRFWFCPVDRTNNISGKSDRRITNQPTFQAHLLGLSGKTGYRLQDTYCFVSITYAWAKKPLVSKYFVSITYVRAS